MKYFILSFLFAVLFLAPNMSQAQTVKTITLEQTPGEFSIQSLTVAPGSYVFDVANNGINHAVGFVVAPVGKTDQEHHIQEAYVQKTISDGESSKSKVVTLEKGEYVYFCPLNPTPQYKLVVK